MYNHQNKTIKCKTVIMQIKSAIRKNNSMQRDNAYIAPNADSFTVVLVATATLIKGSNDIIK